MRQVFNTRGGTSDNPGTLTFIDDIVSERPDLADQTFYVPAQGWNGLVVMTQDEVFKKNLHAEDDAHTDTMRERTLLQHLSGFPLGVDTPQITHTGVDAPFYGMSRLHGAPLSPTLLGGLPPEEQMRIAETLAKFCAGMSKTLTPQDRERLDLPAQPYRTAMTPEDYQKAIAQPHTRAWLGAHDETAKDMVDHFTRHYDAAAEKRQTVMTHCDLHDDNILYRRDTGEIGVLDLGTGIEMPARRAFISMLHLYPTAWQDKFLDTFGAETGIHITRLDIARERCLRNILYLSTNPESDTNLITQSNFNTFIALSREARAKEDVAKTLTAPAPAAPPAGLRQKARKFLQNLVHPAHPR